MPVFFTYHIVRPLRLLFLSLHRVHRDSIQVRQQDRSLKNDQRQMFSHCLWLVLKDVGRRSIRCGKGKFFSPQLRKFLSFSTKERPEIWKGITFFCWFLIYASSIDISTVILSVSIPLMAQICPCLIEPGSCTYKGERIHQEGRVRGGNGVEKIKPWINPTVFMPELFPWKMILMMEI